MVRPTQNSQEPTSPTMARQLMSEIGENLAENLAWVIDNTVVAPFHALSNLASAIVKPVMYGSLALTALHIAIRPGKSKEIAKNLLYSSPRVVESMITSAPAAFNKACELTGRICRTSFRALGNKVGLIESEQTVPAVLSGLITNGRKLVTDARPAIFNALDSLLTHSEKGLTQMVDFTQKTATPWVINQFNATFPVAGTAGSVAGTTGSVAKTKAPADWLAYIWSR